MRLPVRNFHIQKQNNSYYLSAMIDTQNEKERSQYLKLAQSIVNNEHTSMSTSHYEIEIQKRRSPKTTQENAYLWHLIGKLATYLTIPTKDVYRTYILELGDNHVFYQVQDSQKNAFINEWESHGIGWICKEIGCDNKSQSSTYICYYGVSCFRNDQMQHLIQLVKEDCLAANLSIEKPTVYQYKSNKNQKSKI